MKAIRRRTSVLAGILAVFALSACQTVTVAGPYTPQQAAMLKEYGFKQVGDNWELGLEDKLLFPVDGSELAAEQDRRIAEMAGKLLGVGIGGAEVDGYADSTGAAAYNLQLSQRRAEAVSAALGKGGMPGERRKAVGMGESNPVASNKTAAGRKENRRVVVLITPADAVKY